MTSPDDNTEVFRMLKDVKKSIFKTLTPFKGPSHEYRNYAANFSHTDSRVSVGSAKNVATKLDFSNFDDSLSSSVLKQQGSETPAYLKRKLLIKEAELESSKAKVKERESLISVMEPANKKMCVTLENKIEKYRKQSELDSQRITELEGQLRWAKKQLSTAKKQIDEYSKDRKSDAGQLELKVLGLQQQCSNLKIELADLKSEKTEAIRKSNVEIGKLELKVSMLTEETEKSNEFIQSLKRQNSEMAEKVALCNSYETELKEAQAKIKELENQIEANKDAALIIASRQNDLKTLTEMQKENRILKEEVSKYRENNVLLYQEKMWSMQERLNQAEKKCLTLVKLQVENESLKSKLIQWENLFDDKNAAYRSPTAFSRRLSQYQHNEAALTNKLSYLSSHCESLEKQKQEQDKKISGLENQINQYQLKLSQQDSVLKRFQRKLIFLSKEKENCRKLLDSYLSETTMVGNVYGAEQVNHLEEMNMELKRALEKSEAEVDALHERIKKISENSQDEESANDRKKLSEEKAVLLARVTELQKANSELEERCSKEQNCKESNQDSGPGKVFHLRFNPIEAANQRHLEDVQKMREENDRLKKRIKVLEEEGCGASDITMKVQQKLVSEGADSTLQSLKEQLAAAEKKKLFILENAKKKSTEFREAVYLLTGYRIDMCTTETYKLSHMYANSRDDYLLFKVNSEGIQLVETEYSKEVANRMEMYLQQYDSFPAFLASLTMDLFNQQTFMIQQ